MTNGIANKENGFPHVSILDEFLYSPQMADLYKQAMQYSLEFHTNSQYVILNNTFIGAIFAELSEEYLAKIINHPSIMYNGTQTYEYFHKLYPSHRVIESPFGVRTLKGISVPDGMLLRPNGTKTSVVSVYEYTSNPDPKNIRKKYKAFQMLKHDFPGIFNNAKVMFVLPNDMKMPPELKDKPDIDRTVLPFSRENFLQFIRPLLYSGYRSRGDASLLEIQARSRQQAHAGMTYFPSIPDLSVPIEGTALTFTPLRYTPMKVK